MLLFVASVDTPFPMAFAKLLELKLLIILRMLPDLHLNEFQVSLLSSEIYDPC